MTLSLMGSQHELLPLRKRGLTRRSGAGSRSMTIQSQQETRGTRAKKGNTKD